VSSFRGCPICMSFALHKAIPVPTFPNATHPIDMKRI
jgi:hypothetical protein